MTKLQAMEKRFNDEKVQLKEECKPGIFLIRETNNNYRYWPGAEFYTLFQKRFEMKINRIELMAVDKNSTGQYYQQFLIEFEDNTIEYIYVLVGEANGKKA